MSKTVKDMITVELRGRYEGVDSACVVDITGMSVHEQEGLRRAVREKSARMEVVKNSLARRAFDDGPLGPLGKALEGPCALVTTRQSLVDVAKALVAAAREFTKLKLKQAIVEGDPDLFTVEQVAKMKGRRELVGEVLMLISSPGRALAGCLQSPQGKVAGCLKTLADREPAASEEQVT